MKTRFLGRIAGFTLLLTALTALGCGGKKSLVKIDGMITLDNKPLENAMINFVPEDNVGHPASGSSGTDGSFRLTTFNSNDGIAPGPYKVTVHLLSSDNDANPKSEKEQMDPAAMMKAMKGFADKAKKGPKKKDLPPSYSDPKKTNLKFTIPPPDGKVTLELRSSGS